MRIITGPEAEQGSPAWHAFRKNRIGASEAAAIMGVDPWTTPYMLWRRKLDLDPPIEENEAMKKGKTLEPIAREKINEEGGFDFQPALAVSDKYEWIFASLDGLSSSEEFALEIKCPSSSSIFNAACEGFYPEYYFPQLQHQLYVTNHKNMAYYFYKDGIGKYSLVYRDDKYIENLLEKEKQFYQYLQTLTPPPLTEKDYIKRKDEQWIAYSQEYIRHKNAKELNELNMQLCREKLIELSGGSNTMGGGVTLQKIVSSGRVNYRGIVEELNIDVEKYRGPKQESWRIDIK